MVFVLLCWLLDGVSTFPSIVPLLVAFCWMGCLFSRGSCLPFVSPCTPSRCPLLDGVPAFPRVLSSFVSHCCPMRIVRESQCFLKWMVCPPSWGSCFPCFPLYPFRFPIFGRSVPLPKGLVSHCAHSCFPWLDGVRLPEGLVSVVSHWMACPPSWKSCVPLSPLRFLFPFVGWCVCFPEGLVSLCLHCAPSCFPLLDCVRLPEGLLSLCFPLYIYIYFFFFFFLFPFVGWCVRRSLCWRLGRPANARFYVRTSGRNCVVLSVFSRDYHVFFCAGIGLGWGVLTFICTCSRRLLRWLAWGLGWGGVY